VLTALLVGRAPGLRDESVCMDCKRAGLVCVLVARGEPCLGPVTHAGCGALCPRYERGCYGCFGPRERAATSALSAVLLARGVPRAALARSFRSFAATAPAFASEAERLEAEAGCEGDPQREAGAETARARTDP
jgi:coenzyme F420-reducing hydrogenase gamma subunit